jgi:4-aminobutyrate aminotransferase-like enzyme
MAFELKEIIAARLGENYDLHERHLNRTLVAAQRVIGFDKVYARAEGAYLYDMDDRDYLDFLSGYSVFNIGRNHPAVQKAIRDVLELDLPEHGADGLLAAQRLARGGGHQAGTASS